MNTLDNLKSDLNELLPELESWSNELQNMQPVLHEVLSMVTQMKDAVQQGYAILVDCADHPASEASPMLEQIVRTIERVYDDAKPRALAELDKGVGFI